MGKDYREVSTQTGLPRKLGNDGTRRRCVVCGIVSRKGFVIKDIPQLMGYYCGEKCWEEAQDNVSKIKSGEVSKVAQDLKQRGRIE